MKIFSNLFWVKKTRRLSHIAHTHTEIKIKIKIKIEIKIEIN